MRVTKHRTGPKCAFEVYGASWRRSWDRVLVFSPVLPRTQLPRTMPCPLCCCYYTCLPRLQVVVSLTVKFVQYRHCMEVKFDTCRQLALSGRQSSDIKHGLSSCCRFLCVVIHNTMKVVVPAGYGDVPGHGDWRGPGRHACRALTATPDVCMPWCVERKFDHRLLLLVNIRWSRTEKSKGRILNTYTDILHHTTTCVTSGVGICTLLGIGIGAGQKYWISVNPAICLSLLVCQTPAVRHTVASEM